MRVLSLDASSTTIGIAVIEYDDGYVASLVHQEYYKPNKKVDVLEMLLETRTYILGLVKEHKVNEVAIEDYVKSMHGASNANTIQLLAILNMTLRLTILDNTGIRVQPYNVMKIRHAIKFEKILPKKEDIPELVAKHLGIEFPWYYKINRKTKLQEVRAESYDVADAIAVGLAHVKILSSGVKQAAKKKSKKRAKK